jgi:hypothetical protein
MFQCRTKVDVAVSLLELRAYKTAQHPTKSETLSMLTAVSVYISKNGVYLLENVSTIQNNAEEFASCLPGFKDNKLYLNICSLNKNF